MKSSVSTGLQSNWASERGSSTYEPASLSCQGQDSSPLVGASWCDPLTTCPHPAGLAQWSLQSVTGVLQLKNVHDTSLLCYGSMSPSNSHPARCVTWVKIPEKRDLCRLIKPSIFLRYIWPKDFSLATLSDGPQPCDSSLLWETLPCGCKSRLSHVQVRLISVWPMLTHWPLPASPLYGLKAKAVELLVDSWWFLCVPMWRKSTL